MAAWRGLAVAALPGLLAVGATDPAEPVVNRGGCFCGAVRYEVTGQPLQRSVCYCAGCRRASGAANVPWITVRTAQFRLLQGELREVRSDRYAARSCDGCGGVRSFCPRCGTPLLFVGDDRAGREVDVTVGSLDAPQAFAPDEESFPEQRLPWDRPLR
ncbi:MAG: GFA family protein [Fimbriimonadaceae bacterium]|nr:GFA family protein [Fimbriimonadaceae bacterium]